jgi:hypothetical protein
VVKTWIIGAVVVVVALVLLYAAAMASRVSPYFSWAFLAAFAAVVATGIALAGRAASRAGPPPAFVERPGPGRRFELAGQDAPITDTWAGSGRTLGIMAIALVGLLLYTGAYVVAAYFSIGWLIYVGLLLTFVLMVIIIIFAAPRDM